MVWRLSAKHIMLITAIFANVLLFGLIWAKQEITIPPAANTEVLAEAGDETSIEYDYELENVSVTNGWRIEHYRQYELTVNQAGEVIHKKPTGETQNMKYWVGD